MMMRLSWAIFLFTIAVVNGTPSGKRGSYDFGYEHKAYGAHPLTIFKSAEELEVPKLDLIHSNKGCDSSLYTFFTPRGGATHEAQATIIDSNGELIWTSGWNRQQIYNLMVQEYRGEKYLTFWAGNDAVGGHGAGTIFMVDKFYNVFKEIRAAHGLDADLHDFRITEAGTALITVYEVVQHDLSDVGKNHIGPVWDCLIQEIDLETGLAVFQWRALDHWKPSDSYRNIGGEGEGRAAYDFFHMNSIDKDARGNYLTSSRYMHSLTYINGKTGEVIWILGGKRNMFKDLSDGAATSIAYQHDARWAGNDTITVFDNGVDDGHPNVAPTRGLKVRINETAMTAEVVTEYLNPHNIHGLSQGSFQTLPNGNVLLGYGNSAAFTEYASDGQVLCDTHFAPESEFGTGDVQSYRVYKYEWHGYPTTTPAAAIRRNSSRDWNFYVSWNGATEVSKWVLQGSDNITSAGEHWKELSRTKRAGFETAFDLHASYPKYIRAVAMHAEGHMLGVSTPLNIQVLEDQLSITEDFTFTSNEISLTQVAMAIGGFLVVGILLRIGISAWSNRPPVYWRLPTKPN